MSNFRVADAEQDWVANQQRRERTHRQVIYHKVIQKEEVADKLSRRL